MQNECWTCPDTESQTTELKKKKRYVINLEVRDCTVSVTESCFLFHCLKYFFCLLVFPLSWNLRYKFTRDRWQKLRPDPGGRGEKGGDKLTNVSSTLQSHKWLVEIHISYLWQYPSDPTFSHILVIITQWLFQQNLAKQHLSTPKMQFLSYIPVRVKNK